MGITLTRPRLAAALALALVAVVFASLGGVATVTYKDKYGFGYVFSSDMELEELAWLVVGTDIFHRSRGLRGE